MKYINLIVPFCLLVIKGTKYGVSAVSPIIVVPALLLLLTNAISVTVKRKDIIPISLLTISVIGIYYYHGLNADFYRLGVFFLYVILTISWFRRVIMTEKTFAILLIIFSFEAITRIIASGIWIPTSIYHWKLGFLFYNDSNFPGFILGFFFLTYLENYKLQENSSHHLKLKLVFMLLIFLSVSRTVLVGLIACIIFKRLRVLLVLVGLCTPLILSRADFLYGIDGSLDTKLYIASLISILIGENIETLLFGLGRIEAFNLAQDASKGYIGHTFFGNCVQSGFLPNLTVLYCVWVYDRTKKKSLFFYTSVCSLIGLMPISVLGPCIALSYSILSRSRQNSH